MIIFPSDKNDLQDYYHVCGVVGTLAFFLINAVSNSVVRGDGLYDGVSSKNVKKGLGFSSGSRRN